MDKSRKLTAERLKKHVQETFDHIRKALDIRERLLSRQIDVLLSSPSNNRKNSIDYGVGVVNVNNGSIPSDIAYIDQMKFIAENESNVLNYIRKFGKFNIDEYHFYNDTTFAIEDYICPKADHELMYKCLNNDDQKKLPQQPSKLSPPAAVVIYDNDITNLDDKKCCDININSKKELMEICVDYDPTGDGNGGGGSGYSAAVKVGGCGANNNGNGCDGKNNDYDDNNKEKKKQQQQVLLNINENDDEFFADFTQNKNLINSNLKLNESIINMTINESKELIDKTNNNLNKVIEELMCDDGLIIVDTERDNNIANYCSIAQNLTDKNIDTNIANLLIRNLQQDSMVTNKNHYNNDKKSIKNYNHDDDNDNNDDDNNFVGVVVDESFKDGVVVIASDTQTTEPPEKLNQKIGNIKKPKRKIKINNYNGRINLKNISSLTINTNCSRGGFGIAGGTGTEINSSSSSSNILKEHRATAATPTDTNTIESTSKSSQKQSTTTPSSNNYKKTNIPQTSLSSQSTISSSTLNDGQQNNTNNNLRNLNNNEINNNQNKLNAQQIDNDDSSYNCEFYNRLLNEIKNSFTINSSSQNHYHHQHHQHKFNNKNINHIISKPSSILSKSSTITTDTITTQSSKSSSSSASSSCSSTASSSSSSPPSSSSITLTSVQIPSIGGSCVGGGDSGAGIESSTSITTSDGNDIFTACNRMLFKNIRNLKINIPATAIKSNQYNSITPITNMSNNTNTSTTTFGGGKGGISGSNSCFNGYGNHEFTSIKSTPPAFATISSTPVTTTTITSTAASATPIALLSDIPPQIDLLNENNNNPDSPTHPVQIEQWLKQILLETEIEPMQNTEILEHRILKNKNSIATEM